MELFPNARNSCWPWISAEFSLRPILDFLTQKNRFFLNSWPNLFKKRFPSASITKQTLVKVNMSTMNTWETLRFRVRLNIYRLRSWSRPVSMCVWLGCACATDCISDVSRVGPDWSLHSGHGIVEYVVPLERKTCADVPISHDAMMDVTYSSSSQLNENYVRDWSQTTVKWRLECGVNVKCIFRSMHFLWFIGYLSQFDVTCKLIHSVGRRMCAAAGRPSTGSNDIKPLHKLYYCHFPWR